MRTIFSDRAWEDYLAWQRDDRKTLKRVNKLIREAKRTPYDGIGHPEPLRFELSGYWSRRINREHRLVYKADNDALYIASCRYHY